MARVPDDTRNVGSATGNPRNKVALKPGRSLMDWVRLGQSGKDLAGVGGEVLQVTVEQLTSHNKAGNAWLCLKGKVYNVTPYLEFHPGGVDELMKGAGRDATALFNKIHPWVNAESMLRKCFVGHLDASPLTLLQQSSVQSVELSPKGKKKTSVGDVDGLSRLKIASITCEIVPDKPLVPKLEWHQIGETVAVVVHFPRCEISKHNIICDLNKGRNLNARIVMSTHTFYIHLDLTEEVGSDFLINASSNDAGSVVSFRFKKLEVDKEWTALGTPLTSHNTLLRKSDSVEGLGYRRCTLHSKKQVNHNTRLFNFRFREGTRMFVPLGGHVYFKFTLRDLDVVRSYTPVNSSVSDVEEDEDDGGALSFIIKIYEMGTMTRYLDELKPGDAIDISNYVDHFDAKRLQSARQLILLAAGTGFTPMVKLIRWALFQTDERVVRLVFFNRKERDIFWKSQLDSLTKTNSRFRVCHVLSEPDDGWKGLVGHVSLGILKDTVPLPSSDTLCCLCGPLPFVSHTLRYLEELKFPLENIHAFTS